MCRLDNKTAPTNLVNNGFNCSIGLIFCYFLTFVYYLNVKIKYNIAEIITFFSSNINEVFFSYTTTYLPMVDSRSHIIELWHFVTETVTHRCIKAKLSLRTFSITRPSITGWTMIIITDSCHAWRYSIRVYGTSHTDIRILILFFIHLPSALILSKSHLKTKKLIAVAVVFLNYMVCKNDILYVFKTFAFKNILSVNNAWSCFLRIHKQILTCNRNYLN